MDLLNYFQEIYCVSLDRRKDRWRSFRSRLPDPWPFRKVKRFSAMDGRRLKSPGWWISGGGAWGCYRSHLRIIEDCINRGVESVLLLEDDALFPEDFTPRVEAFLAEVPKDWGCIYLGGQHLLVDAHPPKKISKEVYQPYNINRTHAWALRGPLMIKAYHHLLRRDWQPGHHIDHHLGRLHQRRQDPIYCPREWLVGQAEGKSNISGRNPPDRFWAPAESLAEVDPTAYPFIAVLGLHSSGSSCLAGVLYHLGIHLGNELHGPHTAHGYEASGLAQICEKAVPFPGTEYGLKRGQIWGLLKRWINGRRREAYHLQTLAGGKYPQLCRLGDQLFSICGDKLRVITSERPVTHSVKSIQKRVGSRYTAAQLKAHQEWLKAGKREILERAPSHLSISFKDLTSNPRKEIERIMEYLEWDCSERRILKAVASVDPTKKHI